MIGLPAVTERGTTPQPSELTISVQLRAKDVRWATQRYLFSPRFLSVILVSVTVFAWRVRGTAGVYITGISLVFVFGIAPWFNAAISMRKPVMQAPLHHTFSATGISTKFQGGSLSLDWQHIAGANENREYVSIQGKAGAPMVIPKAQVGEADLASLRSILVRHLQTQARVKY